MPYVGAGVPVAVRNTALGVTPASPWQIASPASAQAVIASQFFALAVSSDTTPPVPTITGGPTKTKLSRVVGQDSLSVDWQSGEDFQAYQIRVVSTGSDTYVQGTQLELNQNPPSGGVATTTYTATITDAELEAASPGDATKLLKVFVQDLAGNWSL